MPLTRNRLYVFLIISCAAGYVWLFFNYNGYDPVEKTGVLGCIIKNASGVPCPSCGTTRSVMSLIQGHFYDALYWNPIGIFLFCVLLLTPFWITFDLLLKKKSLFDFYKNVEIFFRKKQVAIPAVLLVILNWIWNIYKGL